MQIATIAQYLSSLLNDQDPEFEFTTWPEPLVVNAIKEALGALAQFRPGLFTIPHELTLVPGGTQTLPANVTKFAVIAQVIGTDHYGRIWERPPDIVRRWNASTCGLVCSPAGPTAACTSRPSTTWLLRYWGWEQSDAGHLYVEPPVPSDGNTYKLLANWISDLAPGGEAPINESYLPHVAHYALHVLYGTDTESQSHEAKSTNHFEIFTQLVGKKPEEQ